MIGSNLLPSAIAKRLAALNDFAIPFSSSFQNELSLIGLDISIGADLELSPLWKHNCL